MSELESIKNKDYTANTADSVIAYMCQKLTDNLNLYFDCFDKNEISINGASLKGQFAQTFKFKLTDGQNTRYLFGKVCPVYEYLNPAKQEYETLVTLYEKMASFFSEYAVSRPIDYFPEINAYIMESVGTSELRSYMLKNNSKFSSTQQVSSLLDKIAGSAKWLKIFHDSTIADEKEIFDVHEFVESFREEFDFQELYQFRFKEHVLDQLEETLRALEEYTGKLDMPRAKQHWDYTPGHVYLDNGKISVIDILGVDDVSIYEDIGHFLAAITSTNNLPFYPFFDYNRACHELCDEFINAYMTETVLDHDEFVLLSNVYRLKYLVVYFLGQHRLIRQRAGKFIARSFTNYHSVKLFESPLLHAMGEVNRILQAKNSSNSVKS